MKSAVITALAATLLTGTSALAQESAVARMARDVVARSEQRAAPPQRESRPQQAEPSRGGRSGASNESGRRPAAAGRPTPAQTPLAGGPERQRPQNAWQNQGRPGGQANAGRPGAQSTQGRGDNDTRQWQGRPGGQGGRGGDQGRRPEGQYDRDRHNEAVAGLARDIVRQDRNDDRRPGWNNNDRGQQGRRPVIRPEDRWDRDRNRPRYDQRRYPHYVTSQQRYRWRGPTYRLPQGYYSFRWQWGQTLPWNWYTPNYYLNDYWAYGLPMPPIGCEWVRVGDDAILVDVFTGRVYQVVYNLFW